MWITEIGARENLAIITGVDALKRVMQTTTILITDILGARLSVITILIRRTARFQ